MTTALYTRVSSQDQHVEMQTEDLMLHCAARRWDNLKEYSDIGVSGAKTSRPALDRLMADIKVGRVDRVVVWRFDRLARNTMHLLEMLEVFRIYNVEFISIKENMDTSTPMGRAVMVILGAIAELERSTIRTRVKAGIENAKKKGVRFGRPPVVFDRKIMEEMHAAGVSTHAIAKSLNISQAVVWRELKKRVA